MRYGFWEIGVVLVEKLSVLAIAIERPLGIEGGGFDPLAVVAFIGIVIVRVVVVIGVRTLIWVGAGFVVGVGRGWRAPVLVGVSVVWEVLAVFWPTGLDVALGLVSFPIALTGDWFLI